MKISVLSSGSKGNTTYIEAGNSKILIDIGNTTKYVKEKLEGFGVDPASLDAILITHTHADHVKGLKTFEHKYHVPVYLTKIMFKSLDYLDNYVYIDSDEFDIKDIHINVVKTSHDADDSRGYVISSGGKSIVYITDTGYINEKYFNLLTNHNAYTNQTKYKNGITKYEYNIEKSIYNNYYIKTYPNDIALTITKNGDFISDVTIDYGFGIVNIKYTNINEIDSLDINLE